MNKVPSLLTSTSLAALAIRDDARARTAAWVAAPAQTILPARRAASRAAETALNEAALAGDLATVIPLLPRVDIRSMARRNLSPLHSAFVGLNKNANDPKLKAGSLDVIDAIARHGLTVPPDDEASTVHSIDTHVSSVETTSESAVARSDEKRGETGKEAFSASGAGHKAVEHVLLSTFGRLGQQRSLGLPPEPGDAPKIDSLKTEAGAARDDPVWLPPYVATSETFIEPIDELPWHERMRDRQADDPAKSSPRSNAAVDESVQDGSEGDFEHHSDTSISSSVRRSN